MRRRRGIERRRPSHDRWLVSYADFITLLFAFFVVMYSAAQLDKRRAGKLASAIQTAFQQYGSLPPKPAEVGGLAANGQPGTPVGNTEDEFRRLRGQVQRVLANEISSGDVAVREMPDGLVVSLREVGFFESGSAEIRSSSLPAFERLANVLRENDSDIRVEGHSDNVPIHNAKFASNWDLSTARATATVRLLMLRYGFDPQRLAAAGYAEYRPIATNDTPEGRAMNRRVDVVVPRRHPEL